MYVVLFAWSAVLITLVLRREAVPGRVLVVDVAVSVAAAVALSAVRPGTPRPAAVYSP